MKDYGMTMRQLLASCSFDSLVEELCRIDGTDSGIDLFRQEYEARLRMKPSAEQHDILLCEDTDALTGVSSLSAFCLEGEYIRDYIDGEIFLPDGAEVTKEQLAALLLSEGDAASEGDVS